MRDTERGAETQAEGEAGSLRRARWGTRSLPQDHALSRRQIHTQPLSHSGDPETVTFFLKILFIYLRDSTSRGSSRGRSRLLSEQDSIPGTRVHDLSPKQMLNCRATEASLRVNSLLFKKILFIYS